MNKLLQAHPCSWKYKHIAFKLHFRRILNRFAHHRMLKQHRIGDFPFLRKHISIVCSNSALRLGSYKVSKHHS